MIRSISEYRGQPVARRLASRARERGLLRGTLLFCGTHGLGKTTLARAVGLALNCEQPDAAEPLAFCGKCYACRSTLAGEQPEFMEIRPIGQDIKVEQFEGSKSRSAKDDQEGRHEYSVFHAALMGPAFLNYRVFLIDSAHYLNRATGNQLLKLLEEAPERTLFMLVSDKPQLMLPTILSRSRRFDLVPIPHAELAGYLKSDCPGTTRPAAEEAAYLAAGRYVDGVALARDEEWREAARALAGELISGSGIDKLLDRLVPYELGLLLRAEFPDEENPEDGLAGLPAARRNTLGRQALIGAVDRAAWWALRSQSPAAGFAERISLLKARISQNVDPALATAAFCTAE